MQPLNAAVIVSQDGHRGVIESPGSSDTYTLLRLDDGRQVAVSTDSLILQGDGSYYLPHSLAEVVKEPRHLDQTGESVVVPVLVEELEIQKRQVESGGVRITKVVHEHEEVIDEPLLEERLSVKRVPINRPVDGPVPIRYQGNTMIVSLLEETWVVEKRLMLKEELHISKEQVEVRRPQPVTLRSEEAFVTPLNPTDRSEGGDASADID